VCPGLCVLGFKYLAALTRRTTVTAVGTSLPNHCLHRATGSISSTLLFPQYCAVNLIAIVWRLWLKTFSISSVQFLQLVCLQPAYPVFTLLVLCACFHFIMMTVLLLCYACIWVLILLLSSSSLRSFLTLKILSDEFVKIAYSPPPLADITHFHKASHDVYYWEGLEIPLRYTEWQILISIHANSTDIFRDTCRASL
jgi:hypothetical protein